MNIAIKAKNATITPSIREFIDEKFKTLSKLIKEEDKIRVEFELEKKHSSGLVYRAEIDIQPKGHFAEARGVDVYAAFDLVMPKIKEQLTRQKDKQVSLRRRRIKTH